jgi:hypothetical protein
VKPNESGAIERLDTQATPPGQSGFNVPFNSGPELESATAPNKQLIPQQFLVLAVVLGVSAATIFTMRQYGLRAGLVTAEEVKIDYQQQDAEKARSYERIMADLRRVEQPLDVALREFQESPFMPKTATTVVDNEVIPQSEAERRRLQQQAAEEERRQQIETALSAIKINMVMGEIARINDEYYRVGNQVAEFFTIVKIEGRSVTLQADGANYTIEMDEIGGSGHSPSKFKSNRR